VKKKLIAPVELDSWKVERKPGQVIVLNEQELKAFEQTKKLTDRQLRAKHLFLFSAYTGLRFSDVMNLKKHNINGKFIRLTTIKTKEDLVIPLSDKAIAILKIYDNELPKITNQKLNPAIQEVAKIAELNSDVELVSFSGTHRKTEHFKKHELVTYHCGRKTFITSLLKKGLATEVVQKIVGIEDYRTLKFYINLNDEKKIYADFFKRVN
jgi:integrase